MPVIDIHCYLEGAPFPAINDTTDQIVRTLNARGIDGAVLIGRRATDLDPLAGSRIVQTAAEASPMLFGTVVANIRRQAASLEAIRQLLPKQTSVAMLLIASDRDEPLHLSEALELLNVARRYHKPVMVYTPNADCVEAAMRLADEFTTHKFILLGMGGHDWRSGAAAAAHHPNIYLETSGPLDRAKIAAAIEAAGAHRVLFGSAFPELDPACALELIEDADVTPAQKSRILFDNAQRLFGFAATPAR